MRFVITRDAEEFAERLGDFLSERIERHVLATVLLAARRGRHDGAGPFAVGLDEDGVACAAALQPAAPQRCALITDLANPTSNRIYASVGYRAFCDWEEHEFVLP